MSKKRKPGFESFLEFLMDKGAAKAERIMMTMDDDDFMRFYAQMIEFAAPKRQRVEQETKTDTTLNIVVNWDEDTKFIHRPSTSALESAEGVD